MSSKKYAPRLVIDCQANPWLQGAYAGMAILAQCSLLLLPWPLWIGLLSGVLLCWPIWHVWRGRCELGGVPLCLHWDAEGHWWLIGRSQSHLLQSDSETLNTPILIVLRLIKTDLKKRDRLAVVLTPAAIGEDLFRQLYVRLRVEQESRVS